MLEGSGQFQPNILQPLLPGCQQCPGIGVVLDYRFQSAKQGGDERRSRLIGIGLVQAVPGQVEVGYFTATGGSHTEIEAAEAADDAFDRAACRLHFFLRGLP